MMRRVLPVAVVALVLSTGSGFTQPPHPVIPNEKPEVAQLADHRMATMTGGAWWSGACTAAIHTAGASLIIAGFVSRNTLMETVGVVALRLECV